MPLALVPHDCFLVGQSAVHHFFGVPDMDTSQTEESFDCSMAGKEVMSYVITGMKEGMKVTNYNNCQAERKETWKTL